MNPKLLQLQLDCNLLNYIDLETPRHYFINASASEEDLYEYTKRLIELCANIAQETHFTKEGPSHDVAYQRFLAADNIRVTLGLKSPAPINSL